MLDNILDKTVPGIVDLETDRTRVPGRCSRGEEMDLEVFFPSTLRSVRLHGSVGAELGFAGSEYLKLGVAK